METDLGIKLIDDPYSPVYRTGGLWQRGLSVGGSHSIAYGDGSIMAGAGSINDVQTWIHESYHYFQLLNQGWYGQLYNGVKDQFFTPNPYSNSKTNEFPATQYQFKYPN